MKISKYLKLWIATIFIIILIVNVQSQNLNGSVKLVELKIADNFFLTSIINPVSNHLKQSKRYSKTYVCEIIFEEKDSQQFLRIIAFRSVDDIIKNKAKQLYGFFRQDGHIFIIRNDCHCFWINSVLRKTYKYQLFAINNYPIVIEENPIWIFVYTENQYIKYRSFNLEY